jgi:phosphatidylglycerol---prolipoprotein diacylglyceryl transferase
MLAELTWNLDPVMIDLGPLQIRYYGLIFAITLLIGYQLWRWQMRRGGYPVRLADRMLTWGVLAILAGARLGHVFFYHPEQYLKDPISILEFWKGGLASHGATVGLSVAVILFAVIHKLPLLDIFDRMAIPASVGSAGIRLGNFLNSEIVGRATDLPWAVRFIRYDNGAVARHPSQLYEFAMGLCILALLLLADRLAGREKRPRGLLAGLFFTLYFAGRFSVEFVKEYHTLESSYLTMGQYLSVVPFLLGLGLLTWVVLRRTSRQAMAEN